jgi:hypothetical protein
MVSACLFLLLAATLLGAPTAIYAGWKGRLGRAILIVAGMFGISAATYTVPDWHGSDGNPEALIGAWLFGLIGMGVAAVSGLVAFLLSMTAGDPDENFE